MYLARDLHDSQLTEIHWLHIRSRTTPQYYGRMHRTSGNLPPTIRVILRHRVRLDRPPFNHDVLHLMDPRPQYRLGDSHEPRPACAQSPQLPIKQVSW
jgi:hypothetical protein